MAGAFNESIFEIDFGFNAATRQNLALCQNKLTSTITLTNKQSLSNQTQKHRF